MISESDFRALLFCIGKRLSQDEVKQLIFLSASEIKDKKVEEECLESTGNPLKFFNIMMERRAYSADDLTLLLDHLGMIENDTAVEEVKKAFGLLPTGGHPQDDACMRMYASGTSSHTSATESPQHSDLNIRRPVQESSQNTLTSATACQLPAGLSRTQTRMVNVMQNGRAVEGLQTNLGLSTQREPEARLFRDGCSVFRDGCTSSSSVGLTRDAGLAQGCIKEGNDDWMLQSRCEDETLCTSSSQPPSTSFDSIGPLRSIASYAMIDDQVDDKELLNLSSRIDAKKLYPLGLQLDIAKGRISQYKHENHLNIAQAFFEVLHDWKNRQELRTRMREELARCLQCIGCSDLARGLLTGKFSH